MIDINKPITYNDVDHEFLRKLFVLAKTYGHTGDYTEVKDLVDFAFRIGQEQPPTDEQYEPF